MLGLSFFNIIMILVGLFLLVVWVGLYFAGLKYYDAAGFEMLDDNTFKLKTTYGMGLLVLTKLGYSYKTKQDRKLRQQLEVLYSEEYADYYLRAYRSEQIGLASLIFMLSFPFYFLTNNFTIFVMFILVSIVVFYYYGKSAEDDIKKRSQELMHDFSDVVSKLALLTNAGSTLNEAWRDISTNGNTVFYKEMQASMDEINNGINIADALYHFGSRCMLPEIKKFVSVIIQSLNKGNSELAAMLMNQSKEAWNLKKQIVLREGEKANDKLLLPMMIMFIGVLIIIIVPIFSNMG